MNKLERKDYLDLKFIAQEINYILGDKYKVGVNGRTTVSEETSVIDIALYTERIPFAVSGINSETLQLSLEVWSPRSNATTRDEILADLNALIGHRCGEIKANETVYNYASFLEFQRPGEAPVIDTGGWRQTLTLSGTMLVSEAVFGAAISNSFYTAISLDKPIEGGTDTFVYVPTLAVQTELSYSTETPQAGNFNMVDVRHMATASVTKLSALILNRELEKEIVKLIALSSVNRNLNANIYLRREFGGAGVIIKKCRVTGGSITEQAGAYAQYTLVLQEVI